MSSGWDRNCNVSNVRCVQRAEMATGLYDIRGVVIAHERTGPVTKTKM